MQLPAQCDAALNIKQEVEAHGENLHFPATKGWKAYRESSRRGFDMLPTLWTNRPISGSYLIPPALHTLDDCDEIHGNTYR